QLVRARLLVVQTGGGGTTVELVHESLIHSWPTLKRWLDETGEDATFLAQLRDAAKQWQGESFDGGLLWRGGMGPEASRFQRRFRGELPDVQQRFIDAVFAQELKLARRKRIFTFAGVSALVVIALASAVALVVIRRAQQEAVSQANVATSRLKDVENKER